MSFTSPVFIARTVAQCLRSLPQRPAAGTSGFSKLYLSTILVAQPTQSLRLPCFRQATSLTAVHHTTSQSQTRLSSVLQIVSSRVWQATHRSFRPSQVTASSSRPSLGGPPPPRRLQSLWQTFRRKLDSTPPEAIMWGVLALNGVVFVMWHLASIKYRSAGDPGFYRWMIENFTVSAHNISSGRIWTLLTSCISHEDSSHLLFNALTYYFMAPAVLPMLGNASFLALYLSGGLFASVASVFWHKTIKHHNNYSSYGASGALFAIVSFFACVAPRAKLYLFAVVPVPAWALVTGIILWDGFSAVTDKRTGTDTAGHIGGICAGIAYFLRLRFRF
ncbi:uncharacterized protein FIBRA_04948 [Fibroporia radiculosa]|uniref:Peptidase S54 rhomboid domain-containing protein n=1 Tax=Fibroporia radiculosa TaxID=599839 RepID=J4IAF8_9APHY|nr:uncharacterized protein FIBRA_04948 [Fibroporia radiculosa]CCM02836.1 predicted protein [Fibroporia radiculosa]